MLRTFLVEDEIVVRETIKKMIPWEQYGYELVGEAPDGEVALPMIKNAVYGRADPVPYGEKGFS